MLYFIERASLVAQIVKNLPANAGEPVLIPGSGKFPWRAWQFTSIFLPGISHGQRSLKGYGPWNCKELDSTEWLTHTHTLYLKYMYYKALIVLTYWKGPFSLFYILVTMNENAYKINLFTENVLFYNVERIF